MASTNPSTPNSPTSNISQNNKPPRPKITLPPPTITVTPNPMYTAQIPITPGTAPEFPPHMYHPSTAGAYMFKQFSGFKDFTFNTAKSGMSFGEKSAFWFYNKVSNLSRQWFTHIFLFFVILLYSVGGAFLFVAIEGHDEEITIENVRIDRIATLQKLKEITLQPLETTTEEEINGDLYKALMEYEETLQSYWSSKALVVANRGPKIWTFWNAVFYCGTIYTTIGYGHMYPTTVTGQALTIVYALIGIPLFLIILTDFGKLFTRAIKFLWAFVRRLYYTGTCKQARKNTAMQEVMKGAQMMYEIATFRRPSQFNLDAENGPPQFPAAVPAAVPAAAQSNLATPHSTKDTDTDAPNTPAPSTYEIDDEFNLPISVAIFLLVVYIFLGAVVYWLWENWDFFSAFYFVFISMSTIGFGDYVPRHPICMIVSIIYLVFGLALMSMCINVVQVKLGDTFRQASAKLGATIGLRVAEEDGSIATIPPPTVEIADVHTLSPTKV